MVTALAEGPVDTYRGHAGNQEFRKIATLSLKGRNRRLAGTIGSSFQKTSDPKSISLI
jgi:hypothetical protein